MSNSIHDKLKRVRKPRVHITYDLETNGQKSEREIPFVMGVMGDYSGDNTDARKPMGEREFVNIDRDNFNDIMGKINPTLNLKVDNTLADDDSTMGVGLEFNSIEDFEPQKLVDQVEPLKKLLEARNKLRDLLAKADRSEELENVLEEILSNTDAITSLSSELGVDKGEE